MRDPADAVLKEIRVRAVSRLVIGLKRRTPVGKAVLGSISQRLLLNSPVPVLAVKTSEDEDSAPEQPRPGRGHLLTSRASSGVLSRSAGSRG